MQLNVRTIGQVNVVNLSGSFDAHSSPQARSWFEQATLEAPAFIVVNMKDVRFLDSTGLSVLVQAMKRARQQNGDVRLCSLQHPVRMIFELTRLDRVFEILIDEEDAVAAFTGQPSALPGS